MFIDEVLLTFPVFDGVVVGGVGGGARAGLVDGLDPELVLVPLHQVIHLTRQLGARHLTETDSSMSLHCRRYDKNQLM